MVLFFINLTISIISFHSFIVAVMRYIFIVHEKKVNCFGKEKTKKLFLILSFFVPFIYIVWIGIDSTDVAAMSFFNKCNGVYHKPFLIDTSTLDVAKRNFCQHQSLNEDGLLSKLFGTLRRFSCIARKVILLLLGFNITEAIIYYKLFSHINR